MPSGPGERTGQDQLFVGNGGSLTYEFLPSAMDGGLLEAATPECRGPLQLLVYQRAQEALLERALPAAQRALAAKGHPGELGLLKNCRDAEGHVYGAQESLEACLASGPALWALRLAMLALLPPLVPLIVIFWIAMGTMMLVGLPVAVLYAVFAGLRAGSLSEEDEELADRASEEAIGRALRRWGRTAMWVEIVLILPVAVPWLLALRAFAFRRIRAGITTFLITRPILTGTGTLEADGAFGLSEKGPSIKRLCRLTGLPPDRAVFDFGNLIKPLIGVLAFRLRGPRSLWSGRQRLQLGLSSSNRADSAELIKVGVTALLVDAAEAGGLDDAPQLADPIGALHALITDPTLQTRLRLRDGRELTALELQRWYLDRATRWHRDHPTPAVDAVLILRVWRESLDGLEQDPTALSGRLDWVTKRELLAASKDRISAEARKKIDLRYHELGPAGYFSQLQANELTVRIVQPEAIEQAITTPPARSPAIQRARLLRELQDTDRVRVAWDRIRIGRGLRAEVIPLDRFRDR